MDDTDKILEEMIARVTEVYQQAAQESADRLTQFMENFETENFQMQQHLAAGLVTQEEYDQWERDQMVQSFQYEAIRNAMMQDLLNADKIAAAIVNDELPNIYALNVNQAQYDVCHNLGYDFDPTFTLYDRYTVQNLLSDGNILFPTANIDESADVQYINKHIHNSITQGILQGESVSNIARRVETVTGMSHSSAVRTARTLTTSAQNSGRVSSYRHAQDMGIKMKQEWMATLDPKTRHSHRLLDGVKVPVGGRFPNGLRYPGDPDGAPEEVYNCRCTLVASLNGVDNTNTARWSDIPDDMTYDEWKRGHSPIIGSGYIYPIYHGSSSRNILSILQTNELRGNISNETETYGVSFTRNKNESYGEMDIVFDRDQLRTRYRVEPVYREGIAGRDLAEERANRTITNVSDYIREIRFNDPFRINTYVRLLGEHDDPNFLNEETYIDSRGNERANPLYYLSRIIDISRERNIPMNEKLTTISDMIDIWRSRWK